MKDCTAFGNHAFSCGVDVVMGCHEIDYCVELLTTLWEELGVDRFERVLSDDSRRTLRLEASVDALDLGLGETCRPAQRLQTIRPVTSRSF